MIVVALSRRALPARSCVGQVLLARRSPFTGRLQPLAKRYSQTHAGNQHAEVKNTRNIGIIAHVDAVSSLESHSSQARSLTQSAQGKTTTTERMLYYSGVTSRVGGNYIR
jgi:hypothetical protein